MRTLISGPPRQINIRLNVSPAAAEVDGECAASASKFVSMSQVESWRERERKNFETFVVLIPIHTSQWFIVSVTCDFPTSQRS